MVLNNFKEAEQELAKYIPVSAEMTGKDITLGRMKPFMQALGNPEQSLKIIHVAGTSGKTSTSYYVAALLGATGNKVGLTVSPHIACINERVQINLQPLPEKQFCTALGEFLEIVQQLPLQPSYFELLIAFVYWYFAKTKVDYAVIETGLGGLHDATNVAGNVSKVCVITDIGIDHVHVLGDNVVDIAFQKAGIIYPSNHVFMHAQSAEIINVIENKATEQHATLNLLSKDVEPNEITNHLPEYQQRNWTLAKKAYDYISARDNLASLDTNALITTANTYIPGRMEAQHVGKKTVILDGAHNEQKMTTFVRSFQAQYPGQNADIVLALKEGKDYQAVLPLLKPICSTLIITEFKMRQDVPVISMSAVVLAEEARALSFSNVITEPDYKKAFRLLLTQEGKFGIVTGSFYLVGAVSKLIND